MDIGDIRPALRAFDPTRELSTRQVHISQTGGGCTQQTQRELKLMSACKFVLRNSLMCIVLFVL